LSLDSPRRIFRRARHRTTPIVRVSRAGAVVVLSFLGVTFIAGGVEPLTAASGDNPPQTLINALPGEAQVIDGATLRLGGAVVRLNGINGIGADGPAATASLRRLANLVHDQRVECRISGADETGRLFGTCRNESLDLATGQP